MNKSKELDNLDRTYQGLELYDCLIVCSNQLIETVNILETSSGWIPLSIRKGIKPRVWLSACSEIDEKGIPVKYIDLIVDSIVMHPEVIFVITEYGFKITIDNKVLVEAGNHIEGKLEIVELDLNPIGVNVHGDVKGLVVGGMTMSRNRTKRSHTFIGI